MAAVWKRSLIGLVDQGFSGLSNVLMVFMVARGLNSAEFGSFALSFAMLTFLLALTRSYFGTQLTLADGAVEARWRTRASFGAVILLSPLLAALVFGVGVAVGGTTHLGVTLVVALATPVVCTQDVLRYAAVSIGEPLVALVSDIVWTIIVVVSVVGIIQVHDAAVLALWLAAAAVALALCIGGLRVTPSLSDGRSLLTEKHLVAQSVTAGAIVVSVASLIVQIFTTRFLGPAALGSLRGASTLMGPLNVLFAFITLNLTPTLARRPRSGDTRFCARLAGVVAVGIALWAGALLAIPDSVGVKLLGDTWAGAHHVLPFTSLEYLCIGLGSTATLWLRVRHAARSLLRRSFTYAAAILACGISAATFGSAAITVAGAQAGAALVAVVTAWTEVLRRPESKHRSS